MQTLESRRLLAAGTEVSLVGSRLVIEGTDDVNQVEISRQGRSTVVDVVDVAGFESSFEDLAGDRSDVSNFTLGNDLVNGTFTGIAGTRGFKPGYNNGAFALITSGQSQVDFNVPVDVQFAYRDIFELGDLIPGFENVDGFVTLVGVDGSVTLEVPETGEGQANNWEVVDSTTLGIGGITQIVIDNNDADGNPTGVTNLDDMIVTGRVEQQFVFNKRVRFISADLGAGDDQLSNDTRIRSRIFAGLGDDFILGGRNKDVVYGGDGDDVIVTGKGNDVVFAGAGNDYVDGGRGHDIIFGGEGDDTLIGGRGFDFIVGGPGDDTVLF